MIAKFNPTGTHVHKGFLKVRIDLYPEPDSKTYTMHYVDKPIRPYTEEELADESLQALVPKHKVLNPCLCHFITIDANTPLASLASYARRIFDTATLNKLDDSLSKPDTSLVSNIMRSKCGVGRVLPLVVDIPKLQEELNSRFAGLEIKV